MLRELLLRDVTLHRRVLLAAAFTPVLLLLPAGGTSVGAAENLGVVWWVFGLLLVAFLPISFHIREGRLGTFGDLLALPVERRQIVHLRFVEGVLLCGLFSLIYFLPWMLLRPGHARTVGEYLWSPMIPWLLVVALAYPLPFALRWGGKGVGLAYVILMAALTFGMMLEIYGGRMPGLAWAPQALSALGNALTAGGKAAAYGLPLALLFGFYGVSVKVMARVDA